MHILLLVVDILVFLMSMFCFANAQETVAPPKGMYAGSLGDLISGEAFRPKRRIDRGAIVAGCLIFVVAIGCFVGAWMMWP